MDRPGRRGGAHPPCPYPRGCPGGDECHGSQPSPQRSLHRCAGPGAGAAHPPPRSGPCHSVPAGPDGRRAPPGRAEGPPSGGHRDGLLLPPPGPGGLPSIPAGPIRTYVRGSPGPSPFLCTPGEGVPVEARLSPEDFRVEEVPARRPGGSGGHLFLKVETTGWSTPRLVDQLARAFRIPRDRVGTAGLKDARAVTVQWTSVSVEGMDAPALSGAVRAVESLPGVEVLETARNPEPLHTGELLGNRFDLRLRPPGTGEVGVTGGDTGDGWSDRALARSEAVLARLQEVGVPNWFGPQRFGVRGDSDALGRALLHRRYGEALSWLLGRPSELDTPLIREARQAWEDGELEKARRTWPASFREQREALRRLHRGASEATAAKAIPRGLRRLLAHAVQSRIFNHVLAARLRLHGRVLPGDLALDPAGRLQTVPEDGAGAFSSPLVPTGPLPGRRCPRPEGVPGRLERRVFHRAGVGPRGELLNRGHGSMGGRRALVVPLGHAEVGKGRDAAGPCIRLRMTLPPGSYATAVLREIDGRHDGIPGPLRPRQPSSQSPGAAGGQ
ncbi:MAG: tRNA pseudouridine(13) synthase TruD [Gemmatimonadales bacterium]|nr:MAG: tRNA pseudouridine(13) synthase TruD [Gemmatimonadales bacterium]